MSVRQPAPGGHGKELQIETYGLHKSVGSTVTLKEDGIGVVWGGMGGPRAFTIPWSGIAAIRAKDRSPYWLATDWWVSIEYKAEYKHKTDELASLLPVPMGLPKVKDIKEAVLVMNQWLGRYGSPSIRD